MIAQKFRLYKKLRVIRQVKKFLNWKWPLNDAPWKTKEQLNALPFDSPAYFAAIGR
jgi:hypothetical protein